MMTLQQIRHLFKEHLSERYSASEIGELFRIFTEEITGFNRPEQHRRNDDTLSENQLDRLKNILRQLETGKPYQQVLGFTEFFGLKFFVDENVLVPRPETEELLEMAIKKLQTPDATASIKILDIGTGSGIIPIVLKKHFPAAEVSGLDYSAKALNTAKKNADLHKVAIDFIHQNYLKENLSAVYDVIISNPPYIGLNEENEIPDSVKKFEPAMALFSPTENALVFYEKIAADCEKHLADQGLVFLEINQKFGPETRDLFRGVLSEVALVKDISGNDRFVTGKK